MCVFIAMSLLDQYEIRPILKSYRHSLVYFNARSLRKYHECLQNYLSSLDHAFSFICIFEAWLSSGDCNMYGFVSYTAEYCHRLNNRHGGADVFVSPDISYIRRHDLSFQIDCCDTVWVETNEPLQSYNSKGLVFGCVYRSPAS